MTTAAIRKKIVEARELIAPITKDRSNPHFKKKYATLDAVLAVVEPALKSVNVHIFSEIEAARFVKTILWDSDSGEEVSSVFPLPETDDPQKIGSAITYGRRYNLTALLNLRFDDDDDGNFASSYQQSRQQPQQRYHSSLQPQSRSPQSFSGGTGRAVSKEEWESARAASVPVR